MGLPNSIVSISHEECTSAHECEARCRIVGTKPAPCIQVEIGNPRTTSSTTFETSTISTFTTSTTVDTGGDEGPLNSPTDQGLLVAGCLIVLLLFLILRRPILRGLAWILNICSCCCSPEDDGPDGPDGPDGLPMDAGQTALPQSATSFPSPRWSAGPAGRGGAFRRFVNVIGRCLWNCDSSL